MTDRILIHSQDPDFYMLMSHILANAGYVSSLVEDTGSLAGSMLKSTVAVIFDTSNNIAGATELCLALKRNPATFHVPLIALVRARDEGHYLHLLKAGFDEGFVRPVSPERILSFLRSLPGAGAGPTGQPPVASFRFGDFDIDEDTRLLRGIEGSKQLSPIEFRLLRRLLQSPGRVLSRDDLIEGAWPPDHYVQARTVDVHIGNLRRALEQQTGRRVIRTIRSNGYVADIPDCDG